MSSIEYPTSAAVLLSKKHAKQAFSQHIEHFRILVTNIHSSEYKRYKLPSVIAGQMKFEAMTPPHDPLAVCGDTLEHFVGIASEIVAYGYHGGINECYAGTSPKGTEVQEEQERKTHPTFKFNKTVIENRFWKKRSHCPFDKEQVIMFEITECAKMEVQQNSDSHF